MKNRKQLFSLLALFLLSYFSPAQQFKHKAKAGEKYLINLYHRWSAAAGDEKNLKSTKSITTSNFYPGKATNYNWNNATSSWVIFDTTFYTYTSPNLVSTITRKDSANNFLTRVLKSYDVSDHLIDAVYQNWSSGWVNNYRDTFGYDNYNNIIVHKNETWSGTQWITAFGDNYQNTYSGTGKILVQIAQSWNGTTWDNTARFTNTYNTSDQITQTVRESWNSSTLVWNNTSETIYIYVSNVNTQTVNYLWNGSSWINDTQIINFVWDTWTGDAATSKPQSYTYQIWSGSAWVNDQRLLNASYSSCGGSIETFQVYISGNWVNDGRTSIFFDAQCSKTGERNEIWNVPLVAWDTAYEYKYLYSYDVNNSITQSIYQEFDGTIHNYLNYFKTVYSDFLFLNVPENFSLRKFSVNIYPNPITDFADVIITSDNFNPVLFHVYDVHGKRILSEAIRNKIFRLHKNNFSSGIYLLLISDLGGAHVSQKFIVQ